MLLIPTPRKCMHMNTGKLNSRLPAPRVPHSSAGSPGDAEVTQSVTFAGPMAVNRTLDCTHFLYTALGLQLFTCILQPFLETA